MHWKALRTAGTSRAGRTGGGTASLTLSGSSLLFFRPDTVGAPWRRSTGEWGRGWR